MQWQTLEETALKRVTVAVVAIGGYGSGYVRTLLKPSYRRRAKIVAAALPLNCWYTIDLTSDSKSGSR